MSEWSEYRPEWDTALICLDESPEVWGQFPANYRWNGWLTPRIDALGVVEILEYVNSDPDYGYDFRWLEDGSLELVDRYDEDAEPEIFEPDEDGLYALGSWAWVWSYANPEQDPYRA